ncbi:MAG: xanthine dehydrogenase family protein molybdopterin-binding subunit [Pseudomonadota bacterium]|nr:xanthine dehydrogenase family protein molybdopterin-binding subunit [Pseudomonadota bacterium]
MSKHETIRSGPEISRRAFMVGASAAGLVCGFGAPGAAEAAAAVAPTTWYSIGDDGLVTVNVGKADMGQHVASTMAQIVADELGASWSQVRVALMGNDPKYNDPVLGAIITGGSWSTMMNFDTMSRAGAAGRMTLAEAGAAMLKTSPDQVVVADSRVLDKKSGKSVSFAEVVKSGKAGKVFTADELKAIKLKTPDQYTLIGRDLPQIDIPFKVNGTAKYSMDVTLPGMLYGRVVTPPVRYGAKVTGVDDSAAKKLPGFVQAVTVEDPTGTVTGWVIAVAKTYWEAAKAADALKVSYDKGPNAAVSSESILAEGKRLQGLPGGELYFTNGDSAAALKTAAKTVEAEYTTSINIHAPLEPMNATAEIKDGKLHIHCGNQFMTRSTAIAAAAVGMKPEDVVGHQYWIGGGFGRKLDGDMMVVAAVATKAVGKPVKVVYSREHDMKMDFSRPLTYQKISAGLNADGKLMAMNHDLVSAWPTKRWGIPGVLENSADGKKQVLDGFAVHGADFFYSVPNHTVRTILNEVAQNATPSGQLRSVAPGWTFWAVESMIDEAAHAAGKDPAEFRLAMLDGAGDNAGAQRLANTLRAAMGLAGYGTKKLEKGEGLGVACVSSQERGAASWTACVAHVAVGADGAVKVKKLTVATDIGTAINPDGVRAQVMGGAQWGMSLALLEQATMKDGAIEQSNFDSYTPARMVHMPEIEIAIIANGDAIRGTGEPTVTVVAPAVGNAIFNAVGARVRSLPITAEAVKAAMKA